MSVGSEAIFNSYVCDGEETEFDFGFRILSASHVEVILKHRTTGVETPVNSNDYEVEVDDDGEGGTVTMDTAPAATHDIYIFSAAPLTQTMDIEPETNITEAALESGLDLKSIGLKQLSYLLGKCLRFKKTSGSTGPTLPEPEAGKALVWNDDENGFDNSERTFDNVVDEAEAARDAAQTAESNAEAAQALAEDARDDAQEAKTDAEAAAAEAEAAALQTGPQTLTGGGGPQNVTGQTVDGAMYSSVIYEYEIIRSTTVINNGHLFVQRLNGSWRAYDPGGFGEAHGVAFDIAVPLDTVAQLTADPGGSDASLKLKRSRFTILAP